MANTAIKPEGIIKNKLKMTIMKVVAYIKLIVVDKKTKRRIAILSSLCIVCLGLALFGTITLIKNQTTYPQELSPVISSASVSKISNNSAAVSWVTDKPVLGSVQIYTQDNMFTTTVSENISATEHLIVIDGLSPNTTYNFQIWAEDKSKNSSAYKGQPFTTLPLDTKPLVISNLGVSYEENSRIIISWVTNKPAYSEIEYSTSDHADKRVLSNNVLTTNHIFNIAEVDASKLYHYKVKSTDADGNQAVSEKEGTFTIAIGTNVGSRAPDFTLQSIDGKSVTLSSYRGKPVMLYFWLWSCSSCRKKLPVMQEAFEKLASEKMTILAIHPKVEEAFIRNFVANEKLTFNILLDQQGLVKQLYKVDGFPATFFIDSDGTIRKVDADFTDMKQLEDVLTEALSTE